MHLDVDLCGAHARRLRRRASFGYERHGGNDGCFNQITFTVGTGDDDLRNNSKLMAALLSGNLLPLQAPADLNGSLPGFEGNSINTITLALNPPRTETDLAAVRLTLVQGGGIFETDDNW